MIGVSAYFHIFYIMMMKMVVATAAAAAVSLPFFLMFIQIFFLRAVCCFFLYFPIIIEWNDVYCASIKPTIRTGEQKQNVLFHIRSAYHSMPATMSFFT